ncbi:iron-containing alcohol dehydrogenase [Propionibacteriaceae bacterium G1746]|uniref:iron-containing alcohol dehydrogenase n=1 Tax=Aestuariimicrobium sp. G57 TaxID=3418485 RepID=UPI003C1C4BCD
MAPTTIDPSRLSLDEHAVAASDGELQHVITGPGALDRLGEVITAMHPTGTVVVLHDATNKFINGLDLYDRLRDIVIDSLDALGLGHDNLRVLLAPAQVGHDVVNDEDTVADVQQAAKDATLVIGVGSGTIGDLAKMAHPDVPLVLVQTALSVNGFADPLSVLVRNGAKRTSSSRWPNVLIIDDDLVAQAPERLARSGVGDAVAIWSAPADWYLSSKLGMGGNYDPTIFAPIREAGLRLGDPDDAAARDGLVHALTRGGLQIGMAGSTAPLSGVDHLISHVLDMAAMAGGQDHDLHGAQVGVATVTALSLWQVIHERDLLNVQTVDLEFPEDLEQRTRETWNHIDPTGKLGDECWDAVSAKAEKWHTATRAAFDGQAAEHRATLEGLTPAPVHVADTLKRWGASTKFSELTPAVDADQARWALKALPYMRNRLTVCDLLLMRGVWNDELLDEVFEKAEQAGGGL